MNRLKNEKSPYLLQHKDNPVHWYAWGDEAFAAAKAENKPVFLSIGYSTCHWCHVMEHDSFEHESVADYLNQHFISIKVDREERPDVDQIYMEAVVAMTGQGGWPLSVFLTPDKAPFFGGTYFPRAQFLHLLEALRNTWDTDRQRVTSSSKHVVETLSQPRLGTTGSLDVAALRAAFVQYEQTFDEEYGGFGAAPKFPRPTCLSLLLRLYKRTGNPEALQMVESTLKAMANGGIFDHLGGGFSRYSTDPYWLVPHFEKMLYDNALLATAYLEAYQVTQNPIYASVARATLDYVCRDMQQPEGGFCAAEDADSEGEEGKFYVWNTAELKQQLTADEYALVCKVYGVTEAGNFEHHQNILFLAAGEEWAVKDSPAVQRLHAKLLNIRNQRPRPLKDDKILVSWNGLMMAAMAKGYSVLGEPRYLRAAKSAADFIKKHLYQVQPPQSGRLLRRYRDGESRFHADLTDHAFLIHGLLELQAAEQNPAMLIWAMELQQLQDELFWDEKEGGYFFSSTEVDDLIYRKKEIEDMALPSGNSIAALNLLRLGGLTGQQSYYEKITPIFGLAKTAVEHYPSAFSQLLCAVDYQLDSAKEILVVGSHSDPLVRQLQNYLRENFLPNLTCLVLSVEEAKQYAAQLPLLQGRSKTVASATAYVCRRGSCGLPASDFVEIEKQLAEITHYAL